ncbi:hypothetical protein UA08_01519 [Talaromyces atroroseus]|uniref:Uncharacterized protein n=1 Tax=Talaromyces atroroseus TaxID=1441469 RepID=A0A1Q5QBS0_TALAT|nr:hypothetical protein UA08_01519 [Talaromyces atroroseus]OKL63392.1 hypothetical protein UA08_01519 [Talaromyces atroroseus]
MSTIRNRLALLKMILARLPLALKTIVCHGLRLSPVSKKQDLRTELLVAIIRTFMDESLSVSEQQRRSMRDPGIKGPMWISKVTISAPGDAVRAAVLQAVDTLSESGISQAFEVPAVIPVEAEWTGYRGGVDKNAPQPDISEKEKYEALEAEAKSDMVILYIHGGALCLMDPCTHRVPVAHICKLTGARVLSVRYRLAPQNPFPAALVDILTAYLALIHPPPGSFHEPIPADKIIISGDSAGGNLSLALLQTLLTLKRGLSTVRFHNKVVSIELPAGVALHSPWCDITRSMPSIFENAKYDYIPPPYEPVKAMYHPIPSLPDEFWPQNPPRSDYYCNSNLVIHPLVTPLACSTDLWKGAPPVYVTIGEESLADEGLLTARKIHQAGVPVVIEQYEGMPHCFGLIMMDSVPAKAFIQGWSQFCRDAVARSIHPLSSGVGNLIFHNAGWRSTKLLPLDKVHGLIKSIHTSYFFANSEAIGYVLPFKCRTRRTYQHIEAENDKMSSKRRIPPKRSRKDKVIDRDKRVKITNDMIFRPVKEPRYMPPYFAHEPLNPSLYAGEMAMSILPVPNTISFPYNIEAYQPIEDEGDSDGEIERNVDLCFPTSTKATSNPVQNPSPKDHRIVVGGRPVEGKGRKLCAIEDMDEDDKLLYFLKLAKWTEREIHSKFASEGRINYNIKTIGTRFSRMRHFIMAENDRRLEEGNAAWLEAEEKVLPRAVAFAAEQIEKERLALEQRKWELVSEYIQKREPLAMYSGEACRQQYEAVGKKKGSGSCKDQKIPAWKMAKLASDRQQQVSLLEHFKRAVRPEV